MGVIMTTLLAASLAQSPCQGPEYRQFDFWIGHWDVYGADGNKVGENRIDAFGNGCALLENWSGSSGVTGKSLTMYDATDRQWHQTWVDSSGSRLLLDGGLVDGNMVMGSESPNPTAPGATVRQRIHWTPAPDGSVRQLWETSTDGGHSWSVAFDGRYVKRR
jgi:hypothetical protein